MTETTRPVAATPAAEHLPPDTELLYGQYRIVEYLNSGGFGITYMAVDSLGRDVVVKECFPGAFCRRSELLVQARSQNHVAELEAVVGLFLREARALAKLKHPNIVGVHQVFEFNNTAYMALDFVEGRNLLDIIRSPGRSLTQRQVRSILEKLLSAVGAVHDAGLLHRDISPDNVIVTKDHDPVLIDFGAARDQASKATRALSAMRVVKDGYSPQEFYLAGSGQGPSSDLYSLAATFYHVITGELPPDSQRRLSAHVAGEPDPYVPLRERTSAYDQAFCDALDRAMAILPKDRMQSAEDWRRWMNGAPQASERPSRTSRSLVLPSASRPRTSKPAAPAAAAAAPALEAAPVTLTSEPIAAPRGSGRPKTVKRKRRLVPLMAGAAALAVVVGGLALAPPPEVAGLASEGRAPAGDGVVADASDAPDAVKIADIAEVPKDDKTLPDGLQPLPAAAATAAAAEREALGGEALTLRRHVEAPFEVDDEMRIVTTGAPGPLTEGWRIVAIGDAPVIAPADIAPALRAAAARGGAQTSVAIRIADPDSGQTREVSITSPVVAQTVFATGLRIEGRASDIGWQHRVVAAPMSNALRPGDEIVAAVASGERFTGHDLLAQRAAAEIAAGRDAMEIAVRRDGSMWAATLKLTDLGG